MAAVHNDEIFHEKYRAFCGSVKYPLEYLVGEQNHVDPRALDRKNIKRLIGNFKLEGCNRLELDNHVPVLTSKEQLERIIRTLPKAESQIRDYRQEPPKASSAESLTYLHGKHRIEAARKFLIAGDRWWTVDLYRD
ncbi:MAG: hypothetical protein L6R37_008399, partial [Teloschistes peruensis]